MAVLAMRQPAELLHRRNLIFSASHNFLLEAPKQYSTITAPLIGLTRACGQVPQDSGFPYHSAPWRSIRQIARGSFTVRDPTSKLKPVAAIQIPPAQSAARKRYRPINRSVLVVLLTAMLTILATPLGAALDGAEVQGQDEVVHSVSPSGEEVLENGLVRLIFRPQTGQFEAFGLRGELMRLFDAGPVLEINGRRIACRAAVKVATRHEPFKDQIGGGERLILDYRFGQNVPGLRYELSVYAGKPWVSATAYLPAGDYRLGDFYVLQGKVRTGPAFNTRVYVNSGMAGGNSGVWPMGMRRWSSAALSVLYQPEVENAIGMGFYSFYRASTSVDSQYLGAHEIGVDAVAHYYGYRPQSGDLRTESLLLNFGRNPLAMLEEWADAAVKVVQPKFLRDTRTGIVNTWFIYGDKISEEDGLAQARLLRDSVLSKYGVSIYGSGEWQKQRFQPGDLADHFGFGEDQEDPKPLPTRRQMDESTQILALGLDTEFGANYAYAAPESTIATRHAPWIMRSDRSRLDFGYPIDYTDPDAQKWLYDVAHRTVEYHAQRMVGRFQRGPDAGESS